MDEEENYKEVKDYKERLGINHDIKRQKAAFKKAWEIRNFEIDKFWQRSIYFWGFIALIFTGYVYCITSESSCIVKAMYFDLYMILLGGIFSVAWLLVICGSKRWQDNWEAHIDKLEDEITGPLYKTLYYKGKGRRYYSVSRINEALALVVIVVWCTLFIRYVFDNCTIFKNMLVCYPQIEKILFVMLPIIVAIGCVSNLLKCETANGKIKADKADFQRKPGVFLERVSGE
jgi:hypothetical protein